MENVDRGVYLSYNRIMSEKTTNNKIITVLRILLPIACVLWLAFIFRNSLQTGEQSSAQSATIVDTVQKVAQAIAPESKIANATGKSYDILHVFIRGFAHFVEFAILGALFCWCYFVYTLQLKRLYLPILGIILVPVIDEYMQGFVAGRGSEWLDLAVDIGGGLAGGLFAAVCVLIGLMIREKRLRAIKTENI